MMQTKFVYFDGTEICENNVNEALKDLQKEGHKIVHVFISGDYSNIIYDDGVKINYFNKEK